MVVKPIANPGALAIVGGTRVSPGLKRETHALPRSPEEGVEIFAIGDIHGRADLFDALLDAAAREPKRAARRALVLLGDLVDRGPENLATSEAGARGGRARVGADLFIALMGNHEAMMRLALDADVPFETGAGGVRPVGAQRRTRGPEGNRACGRRMRPRYPDQWLEQARASLPANLRDWLRSLAPNWRNGGLLFVHAGVNPGVDLQTFLAQPWDIPLQAARRRPSLGVGARAVPAPQARRRRLFRIFRRSRPYPARRRHRAAPRRPDRPLPPQSRRRQRVYRRMKLGIFRGPQVEVLTTSGPTNAEL